MAQPTSSSRHEQERDERGRRHRSSSSSHHHHRTISSTTLLLVLSLVLAVLAVMLSLPSGSGIPGVGSASGTAAAAADAAAAKDAGVWKYLTPKRTQELIARESEVARREAEVARREAELLVGAPGGVVNAPPPPVICPACAPAATATETVYAPAQTVIQEIVKEASLTPPGWTSPRAEEILDRELRVAERERDIGKREEGVNRREHDASRRESWIMEQLIALGNGGDEIVEEEYVYEQPPVGRRKPKFQELPPMIVSETQYETEIRTVVATETVTLPAPANTRLAGPVPESFNSYSTEYTPRTTAIEVITEEEDEYEYDYYEEEETVRAPPPRARPTPTRRAPAAAWY